MRFSFPLPTVVADDVVVEVEDGAGRREAMVRFFGRGAFLFAGSVADCEGGCCCCCCGTLAEGWAEVVELLAGVAMRERLAWDAVLGFAGG